MKAIMVLGYGHKYDDKRVFMKSILSLSEIFDKVYYVVHQKRPEELAVPDNVEDILIENFPIRTVNRMMNYDPVFWKTLFNFEREIDVLYVHDVPGYVFPSQKIKKIKAQKNCKVILDLHEYIPDTAFPSIPSNKIKNFINKIVFEKPLIKLSDGIIAVCNYVKKSAVNFGTKEEDTFILPNYAHNTLAIKKYEERENAIAFVGKMNMGNGPTNIETFIKNTLPKNWIFYFIGSSESNLKSLGFSEDFLKLDQIKPLGMLSYEKMLEKISVVKFTLSHMNPNKINTIYALPNKFYDSVAAGTPVLVINDLIELREKINEYGVGITFDFNESLTALENLKESLLDKALYTRIVANIEQNQKSFVWENAKTDYQNFIKRFMY